MTDQPAGTPGDLSFERAIPATAETSTGGGTVTCVNCNRTITGTYHTANGEPVCASCRGRLDLASRSVKEPLLLLKAAVFGFGATIVGAIIYWAVMRFAGLEIGLIAILSGWLIGKAVSKGANGRGGRLLQVGSALLVYLSVAMAYFPFALQGMREGEDGASSSLVADSTAAAAAPVAEDVVATDDADADDASGDTSGDAPAGLGAALIAVVVFAFALPVLAILGDMPGGLISALIIGFGMYQAWQLTGKPTVVFEGPFRVGGGPT